MKEIKLKPCPFCGSKFAPDFEEDTYHNFRVLCRLKVDGCGASTALSARLIDAVKAWNRRAEDGRDTDSYIICNNNGSNNRTGIV